MLGFDHQTSDLGDGEDKHQIEEQLEGGHWSFWAGFGRTGVHGKEQPFKPGVDLSLLGLREFTFSFAEEARDQARLAPEQKVGALDAMNLKDEVSHVGEWFQEFTLLERIGLVMSLLSMK